MQLTYISTSFSLPGSASKVYGRSAQIEAEHNLEGISITSITSVGKEAPTQAELNYGLAILATLEGTLPLFDNHWIRALYLPNQPINWPESFTPPPDSPIIEIQEHVDAPLNNSQHIVRVGTVKLQRVSSKVGQRTEYQGDVTFSEESARRVSCLS